MRRLLLAATLAMIATSLLCVFFTPIHEAALPRGFHHPVIAAELVESAVEIKQVYGTSAQQGECTAQPRESDEPWDCGFIRTLRYNTWVDFLFIASYATTFFLLGRLLGGWLGAAVMVLAPLAALADVVENIGMLRAAVEPATDLLAWSIRTPSLVKWTALAVIWAALSHVFVGPGLSRGAAMIWRVVELMTGALYAASGLVCLYALLDGNAAIETGISLLAPAALLQLAILWRDAGFWARHAR
jgi:hypothetical protein